MSRANRIRAAGRVAQRLADEISALMRDSDDREERAALADLSDDAEDVSTELYEIATRLERSANAAPGAAA